MFARPAGMLRTSLARNIQLCRQHYPLSDDPKALSAWLKRFPHAPGVDRRVARACTLAKVTAYSAAE